MKCFYFGNTVEDCLPRIYFVGSSVAAFQKVVSPESFFGGFYFLNCELLSFVFVSAV